MGIVVQFPRRRRRHHRASATSRAAKATIICAVTPADLATDVPKIDCHHSSGMLLRCDHFRAAETLAPMSAAITSGDGQSAMISRNDVGGDLAIIESGVGQSVLKGKANLSRDCGAANFDNAGMVDRMSETEEKLAFIGRVRAARMARFNTQKPMCIILEIDQGTYKQYEIRTPLPHRFIPKFCAATGVSMDWLLTGEGKGPVEVDAPKKLEPRVVRRRRAA